MTSIRSELALFCAFRPPPVPCRRLHRPLVTVGVERCQTTAKNGARIVVDKRSLWQRKALKGSRLRLLIWGVLAAFLVVERFTCRSEGAGKQQCSPATRRGWRRRRLLTRPSGEQSPGATRPGTYDLRR